MQIIDLPDDARIMRVTAQTGQDPAAGAAYVLEDDESWWEHRYREGYLERQLDAVRALIGRDTLTGLDIANALDVEHL